MACALEREPATVMAFLEKSRHGDLELKNEVEGVPAAHDIVRPEAASAEVLRRFQREREILASLDHPDVA
jgi:hypothetical protein